MLYNNIYEWKPGRSLPKITLKLKMIEFELFGIQEHELKNEDNNGDVIDIFLVIILGEIVVIFIWIYVTYTFMIQFVQYTFNLQLMNVNLFLKFEMNSLQK